MHKKLRKIIKEKSLHSKISKALGFKSEATLYKKISGNLKFSLKEAFVISKVLNMTIEEVFFDD